MYPPTYVPGFHDEDAVKKMKYTRLGGTDLIVSQIGFGGAALGGINLFGEYAEDEAIKTVREAIRNGINFIDTAFWYGQGLSEKVLGKALLGVPREAYYIGTKVARYYPEDYRMFDFSAKKTRESIDRSLKFLGLDYVDVLQIHDIEYAPSLDIILNETLPTLENIVKEGKARYLGVTGYLTSVLKEAVERSSVKLSVILNYSRNTLIDSTLQQYIPFLQQKGIGVIHAAANSMGLLTNAGPRDWHQACAEIKRICAEAAKYCKDRNVELGRLAVYHALQQPGPAIQLIGMNNTEILRSNLDIVQNGLSDLEKKTLEDVRTKFFSKLTKRDWEEEIRKECRSIQIASSKTNIAEN